MKFKRKKKVILNYNCLFILVTDEIKGWFLYFICIHILMLINAYISTEKLQLSRYKLKRG